MTFEEYLVSKKIDSAAFKLAESGLWNEWSLLFEQLSPASFTSQKLYLINPIRRKYTLKIQVAEVPPASPESPAAATQPKPVTKPVFKPKMK